jgi:hypothetical protein
MKTVVVNVVTKDQVFPSGTADADFLFELLQADVVVFSGLGPNPVASFTDVPPGDYSARVSKLGVVLSQAFTVPADTATFKVPDSMTVTLE